MLDKKKAGLVLLVIVLCLFAGMAYAADDISIYVNGKQIKCDPPAQMVNDRVMVPIRFVSEALGANVEWSNNSVVISKDSNNNLPLLKINGEQTPWPYWYEDGVLYLYYRDVLELIKECNPHPSYMPQYYKSSNMLMIDAKNLEVPYKTKGEYRVFSLNYLKSERIVNYEWDSTTGNMNLLPVN